MMRDIRNRKEVSTMNTLEATVSMMKQLPEKSIILHIAIYIMYQVKQRLVTEQEQKQLH